MYLLVAGTMFIFTACNSGTGDTTANDAVEEVVACADDCQKACCLGCKATVGDKVCSADHSCCAAAEETDAYCPKCYQEACLATGEACLKDHSCCDDLEEEDMSAGNEEEDKAMER